MADTDTSMNTLSKIALAVVLFIIIIVLGFKITSVIKTGTCASGYTVVGDACYTCPATYTINVSGSNCYNNLGPVDTAFWQVVNITAAANTQLTHFPIKANSVQLANSSGGNITSNISSINYALGRINVSTNQTNANVSYNYNATTGYQTTAWLEYGGAGYNASTELMGDNGLGLVTDMAPVVIIVLLMAGILGLLYAFGPFGKD